MSSNSLPGDNGNTLDRVLAEYVDRMNGGEILDGEKIRSDARRKQAFPARRGADIGASC